MVRGERPTSNRGGGLWPPPPSRPRESPSEPESGGDNVVYATSRNSRGVRNDSRRPPPGPPIEQPLARGDPPPRRRGGDSLRRPPPGPPEDHPSAVAVAVSRDPARRRVSDCSSVSSSDSVGSNMSGSQFSMRSIALRQDDPPDEGEASAPQHQMADYGHGDRFGGRAPSNASQNPPEPEEEPWSSKQASISNSRHNARSNDRAPVNTRKQQSRRPLSPPSSALATSDPHEHHGHSRSGRPYPQNLPEPEEEEESWLAKQVSNSKSRHNARSIGSAPANARKQQSSSQNQPEPEGEPWLSKQVSISKSRHNARSISSAPANPRKQQSSRQNQPEPEKEPWLSKQVSISNSRHNARSISSAPANPRKQQSSSQNQPEPEEEPWLSKQVSISSSRHNARSIGSVSANTRKQQSRRPLSSAPVTSDPHDHHGHSHSERPFPPSSTPVAQYPRDNYSKRESARNFPDGDHAHSEKPSSIPVTHYPQDNRYSERSTNNYPRRLSSYTDSEDGNPLLDLEEEEQYEEYQDQFYDQQYHAQRQGQKHSEQAAQEDQLQQQQFSSTHRQFNLTPIYTNVEMASMNGNKKKEKQKKRQGQKGSSRTKKNPLEYNGKVLGYLDSETENSTGSCSSDDYSSGEEESSPMKRHEEFYNYSEVEDEGEGDESDDDDDEERPLRRSRSSSRLQRQRRPQQSVISNSEQFLNRALVIGFAMACVVFLRDHTPWWKAHKRRVALLQNSQHNHHQHILGGSDDDEVKEWVDPMAVYNSNDDDSVQMRDHDPLNMYKKFTQNHGTSDLDMPNKDTIVKSNKNDYTQMRDPDPLNKFEKVMKKHGTSDLGIPNKDIDMSNEEDSTQIRDHDPLNKYEESTKNDGTSDLGTLDEDTIDMSNKYNQATAGERISNRPGHKSLHHGFMDETYENRPAGEHDASTAAEQAGVRNSGNEVLDEEAQAFLESVMRSPTKKSGVHSSGTAPEIGEMKGENGMDQGQEMHSSLAPPPPSSNDDIPIQSSSGSDTVNVGDESSSDAVVDGSIVGEGVTIPQHSESEVTDISNLQGQNLEDVLTSNDQGFTSSQGSSLAQPESSNDMSNTKQNQDSENINIGVEHNNDDTKEIIVNEQEDHESDDDVLIEWGTSKMTWDEIEQDIANAEIMVENANIGQSSTSPPIMDSALSAQSGALSSSLEEDGNKETSSNEFMHPPPRGSSHDNIQPELGQENNDLVNSPPSESMPLASKMDDMKNQMPIFDQAMSEDEIKSVYEDSFYRWNHPFRTQSSSDTGTDVPVFWRIPRSASGTVESVLSFCYRMVLASNLGIAGGHDQDKTLDVITVGTGAQYVNVDMSRPAGIQRAEEMNFGSSSLADMTIISTPFIFETAEYIFHDNKDEVAGKCFTLLRHPVDRAVSMFHHYQIDESGNPNTAQYIGMTIDEFAENVAENNWMVRFLANKRSGALTWHDLETAKEVFGRKCLVGLVDQAEESLRRYEHYFGWANQLSSSNSELQTSASIAKDKCVNQYLMNGDKRKEHPTYEGTTAWEALRKKNEYDVLLYEYAKNLYAQQSSIYEKID